MPPATVSKGRSANSTGPAGTDGPAVGCGLLPTTEEISGSAAAGAARPAGAGWVAGPAGSAPAVFRANPPTAAPAATTRAEPRDSVRDEIRMLRFNCGMGMEGSSRGRRPGLPSHYARSLRVVGIDPD